MNFSRAYLTSLRFYFLHHNQFLDFMEAHIQQQTESFDSLHPLDGNLKDSDSDYYYFLVDDLSERWWQYSRDFPTEFRSGYLAQLYNGMDTHLFRLYERYHKVHHPPKTFKQMSGRNEWAQKCKYLKKYAKVDFAALQDDWDFLNGIRLIRNQIVHHHSSVNFSSGDWAGVCGFIKTYPKLIQFKDDIAEREDGELICRKYPEHRFEFQIICTDLTN
jgi:hypothetical protein